MGPINVTLSSNDQGIPYPLRRPRGSFCSARLNGEAAGSKRRRDEDWSCMDGGTDMEDAAGRRKEGEGKIEKCTYITSAH